MSIFNWTRDSKGNWVKKAKKTKKKKKSLGEKVGGGAGTSVSKRNKRLSDLAKKTK